MSFNNTWWHGASRIAVSGERDESLVRYALTSDNPRAANSASIRCARPTLPSGLIDT